MKTRTASLALIVSLLLGGCNFSRTAGSTPSPLTPAGLVFDLTGTPNPIFTPVFTPTATQIPPIAPTVCADPLVLELIDSFKTSMLTGDGALLSSITSPNGLEVRYYRNGTVVTYTPYQAGFLFETTFQANWGNDPASGLEKRGSFHDVIAPELVEIFNQPYTLHCNEIRHGGASYDVIWPYDRDFYSIHFIGTEANGFLDWHTWVVGVEYNDAKPYFYALMQFFWEP